jgi:nucleotide-binding universal stress UspA family protein
MYKHILLATDGSRLAAKAVKQALGLARATNAKITALHVSPEFQMVIDEGYVLPNVGALRKRFEEETARHARKIVDAVKAAAAAAGLKCDAATAVNSRPYEAILQRAVKGKCDLIVMASHGRTGLAGLLLGSETAKVLTHSKIPVLVVR